VAFNVVDYTMTINGNLVRRMGVCTPWLDELSGRAVAGSGLRGVSPPVPLCIFPRPNKEFHVPDDPSVPMIMIGPGTGVAPFIGFLEYRQHQVKQNGDAPAPSYLYYGCRDRQLDWLFREDMMRYVESGVLTQLSVACSREKRYDNDDDAINVDGDKHQEKVRFVRGQYVQHAVERDGAALTTLMLTNPKAKIFVCGDAKNMVKDVRECWIRVLAKHMPGSNGGDAVANATLEFSEWIKRKRFVCDIWA
jgi:methionine synthase reductase